MTERLPVVILCGGASSRMRGSGGDDRPKPLVQIGEQPVLWHIMKFYAHFGHTDFVLALGYRGEMIKRHPGTISLGQGVVHYGPPASVAAVTFHSPGCGPSAAAGA